MTGQTGRSMQSTPRPWPRLASALPPPGLALACTAGSGGGCAAATLKRLRRSVAAMRARRPLLSRVSRYDLSWVRVRQRSRPGVTSMSLWYLLTRKGEQQGANFKASSKGDALLPHFSRRQPAGRRGFLRGALGAWERREPLPAASGSHFLRRTGNRCKGGDRKAALGGAAPGLPQGRAGEGRKISKGQQGGGEGSGRSTVLAGGGRGGTAGAAQRAQRTPPAGSCTPRAPTTGRQTGSPDAARAWGHGVG
jgi:hypothetical protein